jgi:hypothetical protein
VIPKDRSDRVPFGAPMFGLHRIALHLDCLGQAAESGPGGPEAVRVILRLIGKAV